MESSVRVSRHLTPRAARLTVILACLALQLTGITQGVALFLSSPAPPSMSVSTATLAAPTGTGAARGVCVPAISNQVNVSWTATASTFADGYEIARGTASGGPYSIIGSVSGLATVIYTDTTPAFATTYHYVVRAKKFAWRSANSNQGSVTTPSALCL